MCSFSVSPLRGQTAHRQRSHRFDPYRSCKHQPTPTMNDSDNDSSPLPAWLALGTGFILICFLAFWLAPKFWGKDNVWTKPAPKEAPPPSAVVKKKDLFPIFTYDNGYEPDGIRKWRENQGCPEHTASAQSLFFPDH